MTSLHYITGGNKRRGRRGESRFHRHLISSLHTFADLYLHFLFNPIQLCFILQFNPSMADNKQLNHEEASPLLHQHQHQHQPQPKTEATPQELLLGWTADGHPLGHGSVVGQPMPRAPWNSSICACLGQNDDFCSSDLEVCKSLSLSYGLIPFGEF